MDYYGLLSSDLKLFQQRRWEKGGQISVSETDQKFFKDEIQPQRDIISCVLINAMSLIALVYIM